MRRALYAAFGAAAVSLFAGPSVAQQHFAEDHFMVKRGTDFCIMRDYDTAFLKKHPQKLVTSLRIMGTNAWRGKLDGDVELHANAKVTFRDRPDPMTMYGRCFEFEEKPGLLECNFEMGYRSDVLGQRIELRYAGKQIRGDVSSDWRVIRDDREPDGAYGKPPKADEVFLLDQKPFAACGASSAEWGPDGPTSELEKKLP